MRMIVLAQAAASQGEKQERWATLDFLRGAAIIGVIAVHSSQVSPSGAAALDSLFVLGRYGVNLFFLVSAITMCFIWKQREGEANPVRNFYVGRFLRIAPLFWLAIPLYLLLNGLGPNYEAPFGLGLREILLTATFMHGFWPDSLNSVVPGDWSIAAEMTFYAMFPMVILKCGPSARAYLWLAIGVYLLNVCCFKPLATQFLMPLYGVEHADFVEDSLHRFSLNQFPIFLTGCFVYFTRFPSLRWADAGQIALWVAVAFAADRAFATHEFRYLLFNLTLAALVAACLSFRIRWRPLERIGQNSYAIYLIHFLVLHEVNACWELPRGVVWLFLSAVVTLGVSYLVALLLHKSIEQPVHAFAKRLTAPGVDGRVGFSPVIDRVGTATNGRSGQFSRGFP